MIIIIILTLCLGYSGANFCGHDKLMQNFKPNYNSPSKARNLRGTDWEYIRIKFEYGTMDGFSAQQLENLKTETIARVQTHLQNFLKVQPMTDPIIWSNPASWTDCNGLAFPNILTSTGVTEADLVMVVDTIDSPTETFIARSAACLQDSNHRNIPIIGSLEINTAQWDDTFSQEDKHFIMIHEVMHTLVFSIIPAYYDNWVDSNLDKYIDVAPNVVKQASNFRGTTSEVIITPKVVQAARDHFNWPTLAGLELEQQGGTGTAGSHWEKRVAREDFMVGDLGIADPSYYTFTFALLEDSGWYKIEADDYSWTHPMNWGKDQGCEFIENKCIVGEVAVFDVFCDILDDTQTQQCDYNALHVGYWDLQTYVNPIAESEFQYYTDIKIGSADALPDYCPSVKPYSVKNCRGHGAEQTFILSSIGEKASVDSRCLLNNLALPGYTQNERGSCFEVISCSSTEATIQLDISPPLTISCPFLGTDVSVPGFEGVIHCPASDVLCRDVACMNACAGIGKCVNSKCVCPAPYDGDDCTIIWHSSCLHCNGVTEFQCTQCSSGKTVDEIGRWVDTVVCTGGQEWQADNTCACPQSMYLDIFGIWQNCTATCSDCTGEYQCTACNSNYQIINGTCECASDQYVLNDTWLSWHETWASWTGELETDCTKWKVDATLNNGQCDCKGCNWPFGTIERHNGSCTCSTQCTCTSSNQYWSDAAYSCEACPSECNTCDSLGCASCYLPKISYLGACICPRDMLTTASNTCECLGVLVLQDGVCKCDPGYYQEEYSCFPCALPCSQWETDYICTEWTAGHILISGLCEKIVEAEEDDSEEDWDDTGFLCNDNDRCLIMLISIPIACVVLIGIVTFIIWKWKYIPARTSIVSAQGETQGPVDTQSIGSSSIGGPPSKPGMFNEQGHKASNPNIIGDLSKPRKFHPSPLN